MTSTEIAERQHEQELNECRSVLSLIYNGAIPQDIAKEMLFRTHSSILAEILLDMCNRVHGCFSYNDTYFEDDEIGA